MLPSTGHFKSLSCPFYDSGLCERPYCHFRHVKKDSSVTANGIDNGVILQQLVSEAVKKVLLQTDAASSTSLAKTAQKLTYNPTPIAELKKINDTDDTKDNDEIDKPRRHIPVPYTPHRPTPTVTKRVADDDIVKPFIYNPDVTYSPGSRDGKKHDPYLPEGALTNGKYEPGAEVPLQTYVPIVTSVATDKSNYVPSDLSEKPVSSKKIIEYEPTRASVNAGMSKYMSKVEIEAPNPSQLSRIKYKPTPLTNGPCFSSDEDEPSPKKIKKDEDLNGVDLDTEFELLGQILDEEQPGELNKETSTADDSNNAETEKEKETLNGSKDKGREKDRSKDKSKDSIRKQHKSSRDKDKRDIDKVKHSSSKSHKSSRRDYDNDKSKNDKDRSKNHGSNHKDGNRDKHKEREKSKDSEKHKQSSRHSHSSSKISSRSSDKSSSNLSLSRRDSEKSRDRKSDSTKDKMDRKANKSSKDRKKGKHKSKSEKKFAFSDDENVSDGHKYDDLIEELSDPDEDTIAMECMKIFEEYVPTAKPVKEEEVDNKEETVVEYIPTKKRISHTADKNIKIAPKPIAKPNYRVNAAQTMAQRISKIREFHNLKNVSTNPAQAVQDPIKPMTELIPAQPISIGISNSSKVRIAHVPNVMLYSKKPTTTLGQAEKSQPSTSTTVQTIPKGVTRTAHIPNEKFTDRPGVLEPLASKIPANLRSTFLNKMIDECIKIYVTATDAYARAQQEELATSKKCNTIPIYKNSAVMAVSRLRKELQECNGVKKSTYDSDSTKISHSPVLLGKLAQTSWSIERHKKTVDVSKEFKGLQFYKNISQWILSEEELQMNGFPRPHPDGEKGKAKIHTQNERQIPPRGRLRTCCRCKKEYMVDKKGLATTKEDCNYHPNRKYRYRGDVKYQCCSQDESSEGCAMAPTHVFEYVDYDNLYGYVGTMPKEVPDPDNYDYGVYALDCEMCYTTHGLDLTRVTVINSNCKTVYETLIKPLHPIIDYNTRYSGITEEQMTNISTTLLEVQATLLSMFSSKTILIGHSLESDFKALKLIHDTVIDTSVLFPHKMGPPYKRALRNLCSEHLKKIIQNSVEGHDSAEDATVCMELIHWKLKEELKLR